MTRLWHGLILTILFLGRKMAWKEFMRFYKAHKHKIMWRFYMDKTIHSSKRKENKK